MTMEHYLPVVGDVEEQRTMADFVRHEVPNIE